MRGTFRTCGVWSVPGRYMRGPSFETRASALLRMRSSCVTRRQTLMARRRIAPSRTIWPDWTRLAIDAARTALLALFICFAFSAWADVAIPPLTGRVVDQTGTLSESDKAALTQRLKDLEARKGSQIAVLIVPTTQPETIEQFSIRVAEAWKIGRKKIDDGALMVVAKNDRHLRIEVGYGLEGSLTDVTTHRIIDEDITPKFKAGDFAGGIDAGVDKMIKVVDGEPLPAPEPPHWRNTGEMDASDLLNPVVLFGLFIVGAFLRTLLGRLVGAVATGGVAGLAAWFIAGSLGAALLLGVIAFFFTVIAGSFVQAGPSGGYGGRYPGGFPGGGWSGGGGWGGGGSRDSDGGFSGGGGGFGGGGASGSW
jgi:uncharacterized protein